MSFNFDYQVFNDDDDVHEGECDGYEYGECMCENLTMKFKVSFTTCCGSNLEYKFESCVTFFINNNDKKNLKKFIGVLKNPEKINDVIDNSKQKINQIHANFDRTDLTRNRRLHYNSKHEILTFDFDSSRHNDNSFKFNLESDEIVFGSRDGQSCGHFCSCGDCEYYGRLGTSLDVHIPFKTETKEKIIEAFEEIYECMNK